MTDLFRRRLCMLCFKLTLCTSFWSLLYKSFYVFLNFSIKHILMFLFLNFYNIFLNICSVVYVESLQLITLTTIHRLEVDGKPVNECLCPGKLLQ